MPNLTIEEAKAFIEDAKKARRDWLTVADRSWNEIKRKQRNTRLFSNTPNSSRRRQKYPLWWSIFKIRQPLILSRVGIPIGKDTTQDGSDNIGATAALCYERLAINLAKTFDFFDVMSAVRDDGIATNFGQVRAYYERDEVREPVRERITPQQDEETGEIAFYDSFGNVVITDEIGQDDEGYFIETDELIDVENEKICLEPVLYKDILIDPDVRRWERVKRIAFCEHYSERQFAEVFGRAALSTLPSDSDDKSNSDESAKKAPAIKVWEYWDLYEGECYWFADEGQGFIKPKEYPGKDDEDYAEDLKEKRGPYDLDSFFPCPPPFVLNKPTDDFWPVPEFAQLEDLIDDIHQIFTRMVSVTKAIRVRLLFDNNVNGLQEALNELSEADAIGVPNLAQSLANAGGTLDAVVQFIPVEQLINGLNQLYGALEQRLNVCYKLTGTSDLLQGFVTDQTDRTFGERQLQEKYALNQISEAQAKMQEFVRASYELICQMALRNFKDASLEQYILPRTLPPDHQPRYQAALDLLKSKTKRFRIELETDSTIALNEEYDKARRLELVNTMTAAIEKVASIAQSSPKLVVVELHALKFLIQGFRQGKMFQNEITAAIDQVIEAAKTAEAPFNKDETAAQLKREELQIQQAIQQYKIQSDERLEVAKLNQAQGMESMRVQLEQFKLNQDAAAAQIQQQLEAYKVQSQSAEASAELQLGYEKLKSEMAAQQQMLQLRSDELILQLRKLTDERDATQFQQMLDARVAEYEMQLRAAQQQLDAVRSDLDIKERVMTEQRLQAEHQLEQLRASLELQGARIGQISSTPAAPPVVNVTLPTPVVKRRLKVARDESGLATDYVIEDTREG